MPNYQTVHTKAGLQKQKNPLLSRFILEQQHPVRAWDQAATILRQPASNLREVVDEQGSQCRLAALVLGLSGPGVAWVQQAQRIKHQVRAGTSR